jgi:stage V sporulation protein K
MSPFLDLNLIKRFLPRRNRPQPFEQLDALSLDAAFKDEMRAFVIDLAEQLKGRKPPSSNPMVLVRAPRGSGKTHLVRALTSALFRLGALRREKPHEIWYGDLRAGYIGQTERNSLDRCNAALDGVLSIDDLYMFSDGSGLNTVGQEAFDTVRRFAVENQRRIVVVFENTPWRADQFFEACPHLKQAFGRVIEFPALNPAQLWDIFRRLAAQKWIRLPDGAEAVLMPVLERAVVERVWPHGHWAGGREMVFLLETALQLAKERVKKSSGGSVVPEVELVDIANALAKGSIFSAT